MSKQFVKNNFGWGFILWLFGYLISLILFFIVEPPVIGWIIMPVGLVFTLWVLYWKIKAKEFREYLIMGIIWLSIALILDYLLIVKLLHPADGYYKLSVYIYYALTMLLPILGWWLKQLKK